MRRHGKRAPAQRVLSAEVGIHPFPNLGIAIEVDFARLNRAARELTQSRPVALPIPIAPADALSAETIDPANAATAVGHVLSVEMGTIDDLTGLTVNANSVRGDKRFAPGEIVPELLLSGNLAPKSDDDGEQVTTGFGDKTLRVFTLPPFAIVGFHLAGSGPDGLTSTPSESARVYKDIEALPDDPAPRGDGTRKKKKKKNGN